MKLHVPLCPTCGAPAHGTVERLSGVAEFGEVPAPDGEVDYFGETEVCWDGQQTALQDDSKPEGPENLPIVCCAEGHDWPTAIDW
jgi:hypothetical protein